MLTVGELVAALAKQNPDAPVRCWDWATDSSTTYAVDGVGVDVRDGTVLVNLGERFDDEEDD